MKLAFPAATLFTVLPSTFSFSKSQNLIDAKDVLEEGDVEVVADPEEEIRRVWEQKMLRLKQVIKFKTDLRKGGRLITSGEECNPADGGQSLTDVGILACGDSYHCVEDPSSRLGGVCAKVFNSGGAVVDIDQGGADKAKRIGTSNSVLVKDKVLQEGVTQSKEREECKPSVSIDIGILLGCLNTNHVCVKDPLSSLGGICREISSRMVENHGVVEISSVKGLRRRLSSCTFLNGTDGQKCSAEGACIGLSTEFISNNIGCGSCNAYGGCSYMTGEFTEVFLLL